MEISSNITADDDVVQIEAVIHFIESGKAELKWDRLILGRPFFRNRGRRGYGT